MAREAYSTDSRSGGGFSSVAGWLAFCLTALLVLPLSAAERQRSPASLHVRQLSTPFPIVERSRLRRASAARYRGAGKRRAARRGSPGIQRPMRGPSPVHAQQLRASRPIRGAGNPERELLRLNPARSYLMRRHLGAQIDVDQLLTVPRANGYDEGRLDNLMALGIPVIRDVPPIVIVAPARAANGDIYRRRLP